MKPPIHTAPHPGAPGPHEPRRLNRVMLTCGHEFLTQGGVSDRAGTAPKRGDILWCVRCDGPSTVPGASVRFRSKRDEAMPPQLRRLAALAREEGWKVQRLSSGIPGRPSGWVWQYSTIRAVIKYAARPSAEWWASTFHTLKEIGAPVHE